MLAPSIEQEAEMFAKQLQVSEETLAKGKEILKILQQEPKLEASEWLLGI